MNHSLTTIRIGAIGLIFAALSSSLSAQSYVELQKAMDETTVEEKVGQPIALNARFKGLDGNWYSLKEFFFEDRPVFLSLNYANCPQLCQNQLKMIAERLEEAGLDAGKDYTFISISIDPREPQSKTRQAKESFCRLLKGKAEVDGVHFLVGKKTDIDLVAESIGFVYSYVPSANHYSHAPLCVAVSPSGKVSRYIHGLGFTAEDLRESAELAGLEKSTDESIASFVYRCLLFGVNPGQYTGNLMGLMRIAGAATVIILGACVVPFWLLPSRKKQAQAMAATGNLSEGSQSNKQFDQEQIEQVNPSNR